MGYIDLITGKYNGGDQQLNEREVTEDEESSRISILAWDAFQRAAQSHLEENDKVLIRCLKAGVTYPIEWQNYDIALRTIVRSVLGDSNQSFPIKPNYPVGT